MREINKMPAAVDRLHRSTIRAIGIRQKKPGHDRLNLKPSCYGRLTRGNPGRTFILVLQSAGIAGLLLAPRTMQPARIAATQAARYADDTLVLLPAGNDGVGIVGAFAIEAPPDLPLLLVRPNDPPVSVPSRYRRVILALLAQDHDSLATLPVLHAAVAGPNWRRVAIGSNLEVYEKTMTGN